MSKKLLFLLFLIPAFAHAQISVGNTPLPVSIEADNVGIGGGTQYTEGATDATIDGTAILWEDAANTLRAVSAAKPLPVEIITGASSGTEYTEAATDATITGQAIMWEDAADTLRAVSSAKPLPVNVVAGGTSGTEYTEDAAAPGDPVGGTFMMTRDDALSAVTEAEGDWSRPRSTSTGALWTRDENSAGILADTADIEIATELIDDTIFVDDAAFTAATSKVQTSAGVYQATPDTLDDGDAGAFRMTQRRSQLVTLETPAGDTAMDDTLNAVNVSIVGDAFAFPFYDEGDTDAVISGAAFLWEDGSDTLRAVSVTKPLPVDQVANDGVDIGNVDVASIAAGDNNVGNVDIVTMPGTVGTIADDSPTPGAPVMIGGMAKESDGTDPGSVSAEDDVARAIFDRNRRQYVNTMHPNSWCASENNATAQTANAIKAAPGANLSLYLTDVIISNGATAGDVKIVRDTGGTPTDIIENTYVAINGGAVVPFRTPLRVTANQDVGYTSTTVTTHSVTVCGYTAP